MVEQIRNIASQLGFDDIVASLNRIEAKQNGGNPEVIVPLVGEFSSGKTTLINALTDSRSLETATKPTTATIYDIHFGQPMCRAVVHYEDGRIESVEDIAALKNDNLTNAAVVDIFDTSTKVERSIVLVDTPGLSSPEPKHKEVLVNFLPEADAILLISDINQQITRSLAQFAVTISMSKRPIYLVLTQCDTKSDSEIEAAKDYVKNNTELPLSGIVCVSAKTGNIDELIELFGKIQNDKNEILKRVNEFRCRELIKEILHRIDELLSASSSDKAIDDAISEQQSILNKTTRAVKRLTENISDEVEEAKRNTLREFEDSVFTRLDSVVAEKSSNFDADARSTINNTSSLLLNKFKAKVSEILKSHADSSSELLDIRGIKELDLSQYSVDGISYNLNLNQAGHEYDGKIVTGLTIAAAAAGVAVTAGVASGAIGGLSGSNALLAAADVADTVTDVGSMVSNSSAVKQIQGAVSNASEPQEQNVQPKGIVESIVGLATEHFMGKPQRRRMIHDYIDNTLVPEFTMEMNRISSSLVDSITKSITSEIEDTTSQMRSALEELKKERSEQRAAFDKRINILHNYKKELQSL